MCVHNIYIYIIFTFTPKKGRANMQNVGSICISQDAWFVVACTANGDYLRGGFGVGSRGVCVCVKTTWRDAKLLIWGSFAGGPSMYCVRWSNEAATVHADITADHRDVPASMFISSFLDGMWLTQEPPCRFQTTWFHFLDSLRNFRNLSAFYCFSGPLSDLLLSGLKDCFTKASCQARRTKWE